jgi:prepilin-type N-terminal cleavage/methylation domain-containing protein
MSIKARTKMMRACQYLAPHSGSRHQGGSSAATLQGVEQPKLVSSGCNRKALLHSAAGFTLIEMLIALALSVIVLGAAFNYFDGVESMTESVSAMSNVNENLRGAADLMARDLYAAGTGIPVGGIPLPNGTGSAPVTRPGAGNSTFPSNCYGVPNPVPCVPVITPGSGLSGLIDAQVYNQPSDEITILKEDPSWTGQAWNGTNQNWSVQRLTVATTGGNGEIAYSSSSGYAVTATFINSGPSACTVCTTVSVGDLLLFTTSTQGYVLGIVTNPAPVFTASGGTTTATIAFGNDSLGLNQACAAQGCTGTIDSLEPNPQSQPGVYPAGITLTKIDMITYYLANSNAAHPYTLIRVLGNDAPSAVAYGIGGLSLKYDAVNQASPPQLDPSDPDPNPTCTSGWCPNDIRTVHLTLYGTSNGPLRKSGQPYRNSVLSSITLQNLEYSNQFPTPGGG